jgi:hypothetical protein
MVQFDLRISNKIQIQYFKVSTGRNCTLRLLKSDAFSILRTIQTAKIDEPIPKPRVNVLSMPDIKYQSRNKKIAVKTDRNKLISLLCLQFKVFLGLSKSLKLNYT